MVSPVHDRSISMHCLRGKESEELLRLTHAAKRSSSKLTKRDHETRAYDGSM